MGKRTDPLVSKPGTIVTQPLCIECWRDLRGAREPARVLRPDLERCCMCGTRTQAGIYIRADRGRVPYPTHWVGENR